jgi:F-type H+-transporting ATPase subunit delta
MAAVSSRYARALADVVLERKLDAAKTVAELHAIVGVVQGSEELRTIWENPSVAAQQKRGLLDAIVRQLGVSPAVRNFVAIIIDNRRIAALPEITREFEWELNDRLGMTEAEITTWRELGDDEKRALEAQLGRVTGKKVLARYHRDPKLLGGAVIRVGSTIYDGSVRGQLRRLKEELATG